MNNFIDEDIVKHQACKVCDLLGLNPFELVSANVADDLTAYEAHQQFGGYAPSGSVSFEQWRLYRPKIIETILINRVLSDI